MVGIETDRSETADIFAAVSETASAGVRYFETSGRTFVTGNVDNFDYIGVCGVAAHSYFDTL